MYCGWVAYICMSVVLVADVVDGGCAARAFLHNWVHSGTFYHPSKIFNYFPKFCVIGKKHLLLISIILILS